MWPVNVTDTYSFRFLYIAIGICNDNFRNVLPYIAICFVVLICLNFIISLEKKIFLFSLKYFSIFSLTYVISKNTIFI